MKKNYKIVLVVCIIAILLFVIIKVLLNTRIHMDTKKEENSKLQLADKVEVTSHLVESLGNDSGKVNLNFISDKIIDTIHIENIDGTITTETVGSTNYTKELELKYRKTYIITTVTNDGNITKSKVKIDVYPITYNANNGSGQKIKDFKSLGETTLIKSNEFTAPTGYSFVGWSTKKNGTTVDYSSSATYNTDANLDLYAVWSCSGSTYTCNGGSTSTCDGTQSYWTFYCVTKKKWGSCSISSGHWHTYACKYCGANKTCSKQGKHPPCKAHNKSSSHTIYYNCTHGYTNKHGYCAHNKYAKHYYAE